MVSEVVGAGACIRAYPTLKPPPSPDFGLGEGGGLRVRGGLKNLRFGTQNLKIFRAPAARENVIFGRFSPKNPKKFRAFGANFLDFFWLTYS